MFFGDAFGNTAGQTEDGVYYLARHGFDDLAALTTDGDDLSGDLQAYFGDDAQDVSFGHRRSGTYDEIGPAEKIEMQEMVLAHEGRVYKFAKFLCCRRRIDMPQVVETFGRCYVMGRRTDAANPRGNARHFFGGPAETECFKAAKLRHLQKCTFDIPLIIEEYLDLAVAFQSRDGIYCYQLAHHYSLVHNGNTCRTTSYMSLIITGRDESPSEHGNRQAETIQRAERVDE